MESQECQRTEGGHSDEDECATIPYGVAMNDRYSRKYWKDEGIRGRMVLERRAGGVIGREADSNLNLCDRFLV